MENSPDAMVRYDRQCRRTYVSEIKRAQQALQSRECELQSLLDNTPYTNARYDRNCRRVFANRRMVAEAGVPADRLLGKTPSEFPGGDSAQSFERTIRQVIETGEANSFELGWRSGDRKNVCTHTVVGGRKADMAREQFRVDKRAKTSGHN